MQNQPREPQPYEDCQAKSIQDFWWTSQGMDWGWGQGIKSTTHRRVKEFGCSCRQRCLTWAKEKKNWTVAQWSNIIFSDESKFCISFGNQGPRVWRKGGEAHSPSCLKSSVKFPLSVMFWGAMSSTGVGSLCFLKTNVTALGYQYILKHFMLPSADQLFKDADFIFQQDLAPAHTAKSTKSWLNDHGVGVLDWPTHLPDLNPRENLWGIVKRKMRNKRPKNADELKATVKETWASIPPQQCHKLITSMPRRIKAVIKAKWAQVLVYTQVSQFELNYWNKWTFPRHSNLLRCTCITLMTMIILIHIE